MLGSFYEKAWDFERQAQAQRYIETLPLFTRKTNLPKKHKVFPGNMHLPHSEVLQLGSGSSHSAKKQLERNGVKVKPSVQESTNSSGDTFESNQITASIPAELEREAVVEAIVAGWVLLVHRYQRDAFHNFTWSLEGAGNSGVQTIPSSQLELQNIFTIADLLKVAQKLRVNGVQNEQGSAPVFIFNDGTQEEVNHETRNFPDDALTCYSGHSKPVLRFKLDSYAQRPNGGYLPCQGTRQYLNFDLFPQSSMLFSKIKSSSSPA